MVKKKCKGIKMEEFFLKAFSDPEDLDFAKQHNLIGLDFDKFLLKIIAYKKLEWANWLLCNLLHGDEKVKYITYASEQIINLSKNFLSEVSNEAKEYIKNPQILSLRNMQESIIYASFIAGWHYKQSHRHLPIDIASAGAHMAEVNMLKKIIKYGIKIIKQSEGR